MSAFVLHAKDANRSRILANLHAFVDRLPADKSFRITVAQYRKPRSTGQNAALWGLAYPIIAQAIGESVNTIHEYMLGEYFGWVESVVFGKRKARPARTTTTGFKGEDCVLSTAEFSDYFAFIQRRAAEHGLDVPDPERMA